MSGTTRLEGAMLAPALRLLEDAVTAFERHGVTCWLDGGTLLGVVREGRLLPWDTDIDLSIRAEDFPRLKRCLPALFLAGYQLRLRHHRRGNPPFIAGTPRLLKVRRRRFLFRAPLELDVFITYRVRDRYLFSFGNRREPVRLSVPARFYDELASVEFNGRRYAIPADYDGYLTHRYGDWRTPAYEWSCFTDDLAIVR